MKREHRKSNNGVATELTIRPFETLPSANGSSPAPPLEFTEALSELKHDWAEKNIKAQATRTPIATSEIMHVENKRRELAGELLKIQTEIGATNKEIRPQKPTSQVIQGRIRARKEAEERENDFLVMFYMVAKDSLDPRQVAALESGAKALLKDAEQMGIDELEAR